MQIIEKVDVFGVNFSKIKQNEVLELLLKNDFSTPKYVCFPSSDSIAIANKDNLYKKIINNAYLTLIDGKFTELYLKLKGYSKVETISGYKLLISLLNSNLKHFFYGTNDKVLKNLEKKIKTKYPSANVVGTLSPPYIELNEIENHEQIIKDIEIINDSKPDIVWIGLSTPKQDYLMYHYLNYFKNSILIGIGAVFLYVSGDVKKSPEWIKKSGLRWLYRMLKEPFRLIPFVLPNLFLFVKLCIKDFFKNVLHTNKSY